MAHLIDTNVLVYRVDPRDPAKQQIARDVLRAGLAAASGEVGELPPLYEANR